MTNKRKKQTESEKIQKSKQVSSLSVGPDNGDKLKRKLHNKSKKSNDVVTISKENNFLYVFPQIDKSKEIGIVATTCDLIENKNNNQLFVT